MPAEETTPRARAQLREFRRIVANAVAELRSQDIRDTYAALSVEELIDQPIARLETTDDPLHPSRLQRILAVRDELAASIDAMKAVPPEQFRRHSPQDDVNTAVDPDAPRAPVTVETFE